MHQFALCFLAYFFLSFFSFSQFARFLRQPIFPVILSARTSACASGVGRFIGFAFFLGVSAVSAQQQQENDGEYESDSVQEKNTKNLTLLEQLFGSSLYVLGQDTNKDGKQEKAVFEAGTEELIKDARVIGVYFSASWCAPCRQFTPVLAKFYNEMKQQNKKLEIIWISRDQTADDFLQYFAKMPWLAVTMQNIQDVYQRLAPTYHVKGIPHLVFIDANSGDIISLDGRTKVLQDPYGLQFPWKSRSLTSLFPSSVKQIIFSQLASLKEKIKGVLFTFLQGLLPSALLRHLKR